jgi:hypothetical protein
MSTGNSGKQLSGGQKRKLKKTEEAKAAKLPKIVGFFQQHTVKDESTTDAGTSTTTVHDRHVINLGDEYNVGLNRIAPLDQDVQVVASTSDNSECITSLSDNINDVVTATAGGSQTIEGSSTQPLPAVTTIRVNETDRAHFNVDIADAQIKRFIVEHGPCRPKGPFIRDAAQKQRCFSDNFYETSSKSGLKISRSWLCYSPILDKAYCQPCWLFSDRRRPGYQSIWSEGVRDWKHLSEKITSHEKSQGHLSACLTYEQWRLHGCLDEELESQIQREKHFWRQVLDRMLNVTLTLAMCNLPFRGHHESLDGRGNPGNFIAIVQLLAKYDPVLEQLLTKQAVKGSVKYMSPVIQNELIGLLAAQVRNDIISEINAAPFFRS